MGGSLGVTSEPGRGSLFHFSIRVEVTGQPDNAREDLDQYVIGLQPGQTPPRVLVVEDLVESRNLLVSILEKVGFEVRAVVNGKEGVTVWREWRPHLIWMDMRMPEMSGYVATRTIRDEMDKERQTATRDSAVVTDTKIIALTASAFDEDREEVLACGCDDFLRKPFKEQELFDMFEKHLDTRFLYAENLREPQPAKLQNDQEKNRLRTTRSAVGSARGTAGGGRRHRYRLGNGYRLLRRHRQCTSRGSARQPARRPTASTRCRTCSTAEQ